MKVISAIDAMIEEIDAFASTGGASNQHGKLLCMDGDLAFRLKALIKHARYVSGKTAQDLCEALQIKHVCRVYEYESRKGRCPSPELSKKMLITLRGMIMEDKNGH